MSDTNTQPDKSEEVDLGQLFNAIGKLFERFFKFIGSIFKGILDVIILILKAFIQYFKIIVAVVIIALVAGIALDKTKEPIYFGNMLVEPYFQSKYQLNKNIELYNSLLQTQNYKALSEVFEISSEKVEQIVSFNLEKGPETENELLQKYDEYITTVDSVRGLEITFKDFKENRDLLSSEVFSIEVFSRNRDIFKYLNNGFIKSFENQYSKTLKERRDRIAELKKDLYELNLEQLDSMRLVYLKIKEEESKNNAGKIGLSGMIPVSQEKVDTREYDLLNTQIRIRDSIRTIEEEIIEKNVLYDVISTFPEMGVRHQSLTNKYTLFLPLISFLGLCLLFLILKTIRYVKNYK
ncbi:MAG: hypothetical protein AAF688_10425 [Bacteroidota bacterium]